MKIMVAMLLIVIFKEATVEMVWLSRWIRSLEAKAPAQDCWMKETNCKTQVIIRQIRKTQ